MLFLRAWYESKPTADELKDREVLILELLHDRGSMNVSELSKFFPGVGDSTISMDTTRLWKDKGLVDKKLSTTNLRVHTVELTNLGKKKIVELHEKRLQRLEILADAIGEDPEEIRVLKGMFDRMVRELDKRLESLTQK